MTIRLIADGRGPLRHRILQKLVAQSNGQIELVCHLGDRDSDFQAACLQRMEVRRGRKGHLMNAHIARGAELPLLASPEYYWMLEQGIEQLHRCGPSYRYRAHNLNHIQDYLDYYHILADAYAQQIEESEATHALFLNMPHLGYDIILYHVARVMGLKTLICSQTFFADSFFSMECIGDFGYLSPNGRDNPPMAIEKGSAPATANTSLIFNDERWQKTGPRGRLKLQTVFSFVRYLAAKDPIKLLNFPYIIRNLRRIAAIYTSLPDWRDPFAKFFHVNELAYFEHLAQYEQQSCDLDVPFVYIPLHNQPEMSTQTLGGKFRDQLLIVEAIARILPVGWRIYVKENPRQTAYARGPMFFHRLSRIQGVQLVPSETSTYELSSRAQVTATVCGTAGYEALRKGKPVIIFGGAWYGDFPGVFRWNEGLDLAAIAATKFQHHDLEIAMGRLQGRCYPGVIELLYNQQSTDLDGEANADAVAKTIHKLLTGKSSLSFKRAE